MINMQSKDKSLNNDNSLLSAKNKTLFQLCFPLFLHSLISFSVVLIDMLIISRYSQEAAAAISIANQVLLIAYEFSVLLGVGGVIVIAQSIGRNDVDYAKFVAKITVIANAFLSFLMSLVLAILAPFLLYWINTPLELYDDALLYVYICCVSLTFNGFMLAAIHCLKGFGLTKTIFIMGLLSQSLYIILEYVLILGWGPIPSLGVFGSAMSTLIIRVLATFLLFFILIKSLSLDIDLNLDFNRAYSIAKNLFKLSFPSVSDNIAYGFYQLIIIGFIASMGVTVVLSRTYTMIANSFMTLVIMVVSQGNEIILGYYVGGKELNKKINNRALKSALIASILSTLIAILLYLLSDQFFQLFTSDKEVLAIGKQLFFLNIFLQPVFACNAILFHSLKAVGDVNWPVIASQLITWCISLPIAYIVCLPLGFGIVGVWCVFIFEEALKTITMLCRWYQQPWLKG